MRFKTFGIGLVALSSVIGTAQAQNLEISIYNGNLALVKDTRRLDLSPGVNDIAFEGVASALKPESVMIIGDRIHVLEQNYDYNLMTLNNMIEKSVGQTVKTVETNPKTGEKIFDTAKILSATDGRPVLAFEHGIEADFGGQLIFENMPTGLQSKPTLAAKINSQEAGAKDLSLVYLTNGMSWKTNYVAHLTSENRMDLTAWVTINNQSGIDYRQARIQLIAGDVNQVSTARPMSASNRMMLKTASVETVSLGADAGNIEPEQMNAYQLYTLPNETDLNDRQTKQITLFEKRNVLYRKEGRLSSSLYFGNNNRSEFEKVNPQLYYLVRNTEKSDFGVPLPAGIVRVYDNDSNGGLQFVGEDSIRHIAKNEEVSLHLGSLFNVTGKGKVLNITKLSEDRTSVRNNCPVYKVVRNYEVSIQLSNGGKTAEEVVFTQPLSQNMSIVAQNPTGKSKNANLYEWRLTVPAEGKTELTYTVQRTDEDRRCD